MSGVEKSVTVEKGLTVEERLIVALDFPTWAEAEDLVLRLGGGVKYYKVGLELYLASRGAAVEELRRLGKEVFLDLKFHDIPNTVAQACRQAVDHGAAIFNVHAAGGREMLEQGTRATTEQAKIRGITRPLLIAVTVLTSMNQNDLQEIGLVGVKETVARFAGLAQAAGLDGVVASPQEIAIIRAVCGSYFKIVCPGVRPEWAAKGDQKRVMTPKEAIEAGADYLVVGRPITQARDPQEAAALVRQEIEEALR